MMDGSAPLLADSSGSLQPMHTIAARNTYTAMHTFLPFSSEKNKNKLACQ